MQKAKYSIQGGSKRGSLKNSIGIWHAYDNISSLLSDTNNVSLTNFSINPSSVLLLSIIGLSTFFVLTVSKYRVVYLLYHSTLCLHSLWLPVIAGNSVQPGRSLPVHINWAAIGLHWPLMTENQEDFFLVWSVNWPFMMVIRSHLHTSAQFRFDYG